MLFRAKKTLAPLIAAGVMMGGVSSAQAVLKAGDMAGSVGVSFLFVDDSSIKFSGSTAAVAGLPVDQKVHFKRGDDTVTTSLGFLYMMTNEIGIDFGLLWPATITQKVWHPGEVTKGKYEFDLMPIHLAGRWFFMDPQDNLRPYVALGAHYTDVKKARIRDVKLSQVTFDKSYGVMGRVGLAYGLDDFTFVDGSLSYYNLEPDGSAKVHVKHGATLHNVKVKGAKLNPMVLNISLSMKI